MNKTASWLLNIFCIVVMGAILFVVKHRVQEIKKEVAEIENNIAASKATIHVLKAEWAYVTQPNKIKESAKQYLHLKEIDPAQTRVIDLSTSKVQQP